MDDMSNGCKVVSSVDRFLDRAGSLFGTIFAVVATLLSELFGFVVHTTAGKIIAVFVTLLIIANVAPELAQQISQAVGIGLALVIVIPIIVVIAILWWLYNKFWWL